MSSKYTRYEGRIGRDREMYNVDCRKRGKYEIQIGIGQAQAQIQIREWKIEMGE